eukprot:CAMPEP_0113410918 /NCGR_PEP_ID=MMETSP0013_2-20120614/21969_1 /TAXON_ID=2843 ORGANISM="Skeletonema costatum, Strain 1716" /NCGR_SAMPLE_ID=MMETSP0013_2 /ASSEMBLY_ACC=CAM_ASM_000158 /LENGTH=45 /DNA_ID=CAMNT_0000297199 /DNA_START=302 /DNA_END=439 /DNA_ORIENTATION=+ /assembly_acc=CAM_ASM_000158
MTMNFGGALRRRLRRRHNILPLLPLRGGGGKGTTATADDSTEAAG